MRMFAWTLMVVFACTLGCNQPVETIPAVAPESSGTTDAHADHDHDHDHEHAEEGADHEGHSHAEEGSESAESGASESAEQAPESAASESAEENAEGKEKEGTEDSAGTSKSEKIRFVADKRINVPSMMCPYSCWPKVKETLAAQPGVEAVQLAEQPKGTAEGEIVERVVELKLNGDFDADAAVAALAKVDFDDAEVAN